MSAQSGANTQPPEERYRAQLDQLTAMGFVNRDANLQGKLQWKSLIIIPVCIIFLQALFIFSGPKQSIIICDVWFHNKVLFYTIVQNFLILTHSFLGERMKVM